AHHLETPVAEDQIDFEVEQAMNALPVLQPLAPNEHRSWSMDCYKTGMPIAPEIDALLRKAIEEKRLVELVYNEKRRIAEPHDYGVQNGSIKLLGYQLSGASSGPLPNSRWFHGDLIRGICQLDRKFPGGRGV